MAKKKKHEEHEEHVNHERWLITYADMITLLMVLFIVLFSIGQTDLKKFKEFAGGISKNNGGAGGDIVEVQTAGSTGGGGGDGILDGGQYPDSGQLVAANRALEEKAAHDQAVSQNHENLVNAEHQISDQLAAQGLQDQVQLKVDDERGLIVTVLTDQVLFASGSGTLKSGDVGVLDGVIGVLKTQPNNIVVEGHTDNRPISGTYPSNWELSTARATSVLRYMLTKGVTADRLQAAGYGDNKPIASNDTPEGRAKNRRVEIIVLSNLKAASKTATKSSTAKVDAPAADISKVEPPAVDLAHE